MKPIRVEIIEKQRVFDDFFKIDAARLRFERFDGAMSPPQRRLNFERGDGVAALLCDWQARRVVLVRQFRYPAWTAGRGWLLETVAGILESGEDPVAAMRREIREETGYEAVAIEPISQFFLSPGGSSERIFLYCAEVRAGHRQGGGGLAAEGEDIEVVELGFDVAWGMAEAGEIVDAKTLIGLMWLRQRGV